jgi:hypothetical protein
MLRFVDDRIAAVAAVFIAAPDGVGSQRPGVDAE